MFHNPVFVQRLSAVLFACLSCAGPSWAQDNSAFGTMQPIVVTPTLFPTPLDEIGNSVSVVTSDDIERKQERTLPDALKDVPGLNLVQTGGPGGQTSVFIRGADSNHTKVLIDGMEVNDPSTPDGSFDFSQIPAWDIERIEVLRGPQSGLYGSDAIGGVINIITKQGSGPMLATAMAEGGSFATFNQAAGVSGSQGRANYDFNFVHLRTADLPVTPSYALAPGEARNDDFNSNRTFSGKAGADLTDNFSVSLVGRYVDSLVRSTTDTFSVPPFTGVPEGTQSMTQVHEFFTRGEAKLLSFDGDLENPLLDLEFLHPLDLCPSSAAHRAIRRRLDVQIDGLALQDFVPGLVRAAVAADRHGRNLLLIRFAHGAYSMHEDRDGFFDALAATMRRVGERMG